MTKNVLSWRRQHRFFIALLVGLFVLLGLLAVRYDKQWDITEGQRNQLTTQSVALLEQLEAPLQITAFVRGNPQIKRLIQRLVSQYQQWAEIQLSYLNPDLSPEPVRRYQIEQEGEMLIRYQNKTAVARQLSEQGLSEAINRLLVERPPRVVFLTGHGEREFDDSPTGYALLLKQLANLGVRVSLLDLQQNPRVPSGTDLLVLSDPQTAYSSAAQQAIIDYLSQGRLLWLTEPASVQLPELVSLLGVRGEAAVLHNQSAKNHGFTGERLVVIEPKSSLPILETIDSLLVFSSLGYLKVLPTQAEQNWVKTPLLTVTEKTVILQDQQVTAAHLPLTIAIKLTSKELTKNSQVVLMADADFLSNQLIKLGQNITFAVNLFTRMLQPEDRQLTFEQNIPKPVIMTPIQLAQQAAFYILIVPLLVILLGYWARRQLCSD